MYSRVYSGTSLIQKSRTRGCSDYIVQCLDCEMHNMVLIKHIVLNITMITCSIKWRSEHGGQKEKRKRRGWEKGEVRRGQRRREKGEERKGRRGSRGERLEREKRRRKNLSTGIEPVTQV